MELMVLVLSVRQRDIQCTATVEYCSELSAVLYSVWYCTATVYSILRTVHCVLHYSYHHPLQHPRPWTPIWNHRSELISVPVSISVSIPVFMFVPTPVPISNSISFPLSISIPGLVPVPLDRVVFTVNPAHRKASTVHNGTSPKGNIFSKKLRINCSYVSVPPNIDWANRQ